MRLYKTHEAFSGDLLFFAKVLFIKGFFACVNMSIVCLGVGFKTNKSLTVLIYVCS